jgi:hypothetical protein
MTMGLALYAFGLTVGYAVLAYYDRDLAIALTIGFVSLIVVPATAGRWRAKRK